MNKLQTTNTKHSYLRKVFTVFIMIAMFFSLFVPSSKANTVKAESDTELVDSGIHYIDGIEKAATEDPNTGETVMVDALHINPYRGIHVWAADLVLTNSDDNQPVEPYLAAIMKERSLGYFAVDISDFSGAYHITDEGDRGDDALLTESALAALDQSLNNFKKNNMQVIIRFVYDKGNNGIEDDEGFIISDDEVVVPRDWVNYNRVVEARQDMILQHIEQLAPVLVENADVINTVQIGFYGAYGELHATGMVSDKYIAEALDKMLQETRGSDLRISVRTPRRYAYYREVALSNIESDTTTEDEDAYRAAIFNDGYLGTHNDWGTFNDREKETNWMATQNLHNPYGGDAIPAPGGTTVGDPAKPPMVYTEMFKVHTSYITPDPHLVNYWKETTYDGSDAEYQGKDLYTFIENHLGYRFVIRDSKISETLKGGETLHNTFQIQNVGFGNLLYPMKSYAYITDENGKVIVGPTEVNIDPRDYKINETVSSSIDMAIPDNIQAGKYNLYVQFKIDDREVDGETKPYGSIRFANPSIWNAKLEANYLGSFKVNREVKIIKTWNDEEYPHERPDSLTFTIEKLNVPDEYQQVEYIEATGTQWIDTGIEARGYHTIYADGKATEGKSSSLIQAFANTVYRLGNKLYGRSKKIGYFWELASNYPIQRYVEIPYDNLNGIDITKRFQITQDSSGITLKQEDLEKSESYSGSAHNSTGSNWWLFKSNEDASYGTLYEAKIIEDDELIHHYIPCYRKSDNVIGVYDAIYDAIYGGFFTNAGEGEFLKGEDYSITKTIDKEDWIIDGNTWETTIQLDVGNEKLYIYEQDIEHYTSDATNDNRKVITDTNKVDITNTFSDEKLEVIFDLDGGTLGGKTGTFTIVEIKDHYITIPNEVPTKKGYTFEYWEGSKYYPGDQYKVVDNHTFKAKWKPNPTPKGKDTTYNNRYDVPYTKDETNLKFWTILMLLSCIAFITSLGLKKRYS